MSDEKKWKHPLPEEVKDKAQEFLLLCVKHKINVVSVFSQSRQDGQQVIAAAGDPNEILQLLCAGLVKFENYGK
jgi:hypothetical protein